MSICCVWVCNRVRVCGAVLQPVLDLMTQRGNHVEEYVLGRVWSLGQVSFGALGGGVITSGLVIERFEMGQVLLIFGAYAFAMALEFGDTEMWPHVCPDRKGIVLRDSG